MQGHKVLSRASLLIGLGWVGVILYFYWQLLLYNPSNGARLVISAETLKWFSRQFFTLQGAGFLVVVLALRRGRWAGAYLAVSAVALLAFSSRPLFVLGFALFAAWLLCALQTMRFAIRRWIGQEFSEWGFAVAALFSFAIVAAFWLGLVKLLTLAASVLLAIGLSVPGLWLSRKKIRCELRSLIAWLDSLGPLGLVSLEACWVFLALTFVWSTAPETASDSSRAYLPVIRHIASSNGLAPQFVDWGRLMPKAIQASLVPAFQLGGFDLVKRFSWLAVVGIALLTVEETRKRFGQEDWALLAGAIVLGCPLLLRLSTEVYMDHFIGLLSAAGIFLLLRAIAADSLRAAYLSAAFMACAAQIKYNAILFCIVWAIVFLVAVWRRKGFRAGVLWAVGPMLAGGIISLPWFIYTWRITGNPVYPYLNGVFQSPYWPAGQSAAFNLGQFKVGERPLDLLLFLWHATFHTSRIGELPDGFLGFWLLALIPFLLLSFRNVRRNALGLFATGLLMVVGICISTHYGRYWLPALPLLLIPMVISISTLSSESKICIPRIIGAFLAAAALPILLLPLLSWGWNGQKYWDLYVGKMTRDDFLTASFPGYPLVKEINKWIERDSGILCSGYTGVYTIQARSHEFPFWHTPIMGVKTEEDFRKLIERNRIRYWLINYGSHDEVTYFSGSVNASSAWLTESRLVQGCGSYAVYDVSPKPPTSKLKSIGDLRLVPAFDPTPGPLLQEIWRPLSGSGLTQENDAILVPNDQVLMNEFSIPSGAAECEIDVSFAGRQRGRHGILMTIEWIGIGKNVVAKESGGVLAVNTFQDFKGRLFSRVPAHARTGRLVIRPWNSLPVSLKETTVRFLNETKNEN